MSLPFMELRKNKETERLMKQASTRFSFLEVIAFLACFAALFINGALLLRFHREPSAFGIGIPMFVLLSTMITRLQMRLDATTKLLRNVTDQFTALSDTDKGL